MQKNPLVGALFGVLLAPAVLLPAKAEAQTVVDFLGDRYGSYSFALMYAASAIVNNNTSDIRAVVQEAFGAADNLKRLNQNEDLRKHTFAITTTAAMYSARKGVPKEIFPEPIEGMLNVFNSANFCTWFVTTDETIKTVDDLAGKKFDAGPYGNFLGAIGDYLLEAYGMKDKLGELLHTADSPTQFDNFINGGVDAILGGSVVTGPEDVSYNALTKKLMAARTVWPISFTPEKIKEAARISGIPFSPCQVKAGTANPNAPAYIGNSFAGNVVAHKDMETVYRIVKLLIEHVEQFGKYSEQAKYAMRRDAMSAIDVPVADFHPGAVRAYREAGLKIGEENFQ